MFEALPSGWTSGSQNAELTAPDGAADDSLGSAVAISGSTIVATAIGHKIGANDAQGAGYVYTQPAGGWASTNQAAELTASDGGDNDELGYSAAIQGSTVVLGAPYHDDPSGTAVGAAYLYAEPSAGWRASTETQQLLPGPNDAPGSGLGFGESAAIGGPVVAVGSSYNDPAHPGGTAYAFVNPPGYVNSVPTVSIKSPQNGADYAQGQVIHAQYSCAAAPPATLASCVGSVPDGALIDTTDPGSHTVSVTATDSNGVIVSQSVTYAVHAILPGQGPVLSGLRQSHARWREGASAASISRGGPSIIPLGTIFNFAIDQRATVTVTFARLAGGPALRGAGHSTCVSRARVRRHRPRCAKLTTDGSLGFDATPGNDAIWFDGRLSGTAELSPGAYRATFVATGAQGSPTSPQSLQFTIVQPHRRKARSRH